jgi:hypothetical protein
MPLGGRLVLWSRRPFALLAAWFFCEMTFESCRVETGYLLKTKLDDDEVQPLMLKGMRQI